jgi:hypothetical protein
MAYRLHPQAHADKKSDDPVTATTSLALPFKLVHDVPLGSVAGVLTA